ncbi:hypothetical protein [Sphingomonas sp.]|uniref:hypothetical protein n=1 Tax=Sphingomonas sp. TaxID=28214 RepID=UPI001D5262CA|nr:hypothetical protein [Sphingomonas sp.]MBX9796772.1 hypothetical protein [Sphingomonas sp.]
MSSETGVNALRRQLRANEQSLSHRYAARLAAIDQWRLAVVVLGIVAGFGAALSKLFEGTPGIVMAVLGGGFVLVFGSLVAVLDYRKLEISREAQHAHQLADQSLDLAEEREAALDAARQLDLKRRERLLAIEQMVEAIEAGLIRKEDSKATADALLRRAIAAIRKAVDYQAPDFFTVSIFQRLSDGNGGEKMCRIAAQWSDPEKAAAGGRDWALGQGYTGVAWNNARVNPAGDVIESDTSLDHCRAQYPVEHADPKREALYRSVAAIPILIGKDNTVWGVVTATSDRAGVFTREPTHVTVQNVDMIRDIARVSALLAGLPDPPDDSPRAAGRQKGGWLGRNK